MNKIDALELDSSLEQQTPQEILAYAIEQYDHIAISFSGAEDVALIHMAVKFRKDIPVFCLDTGRLHPETYRFIERVKKFYKLKIEMMFPPQDQVQKLVSEKGLFSFYEDNHQECCGIRKLAPLKSKLAGLDAWITGQRKDQSPDTRAHIPVVQEDPAFSGRNETLVKFNPLANWSSAQVWNYIREFEVPYNALHDQGFVSIGCEPCTRPVGPGQHEREGRWWWEDATKKECGLHSSNLDDGPA